MRRLSALLAKSSDPYAGVDLANAARIGAAVWFLGAALTAILLPLAPPNHPLGDAGWLIAIAVVAAALMAGQFMRRIGSTPALGLRLVLSYAGLAAIALMVWLSGGGDAPYAQLFLLAALYTCAVHPARRVLPYLVALVFVNVLPLTYSDRTFDETVTLGTELFVWMSLGLIMLYTMSVVRAQRLGLRREHDEARQQARVDQLTGLLNRRAFDEALAGAIDAARMTAEPLSVLVGDVDDFKDFNDRFGHLEGDRVLKAVAESLRGALRRPDVAYRWGGDEFAVILPGADQDAAELVAERVCAAIGRSPGPGGEPLGISFGAAELDLRGGGSAPELLVAADQALMHAKGSGAFEVPGSQG